MLNFDIDFATNGQLVAKSMSVQPHWSTSQQRRLCVASTEMKSLVAAISDIAGISYSEARKSLPKSEQFG